MVPENAMARSIGLVHFWGNVQKGKPSCRGIPEDYQPWVGHGPGDISPRVSALQRKQQLLTEWRYYGCDDDNSSIDPSTSGSSSSSSSTPVSSSPLSSSPLSSSDKNVVTGNSKFQSWPYKPHSKKPLNMVKDFGSPGPAVAPSSSRRRTAHVATAQGRRLGGTQVGDGAASTDLPMANQPSDSVVDSDVEMFVPESSPLLAKQNLKPPRQGAGASHVDPRPDSGFKIFNTHHSTSSFETNFEDVDVRSSDANPKDKVVEPLCHLGGNGEGRHMSVEAQDTRNTVKLAAGEKYGDRNLYKAEEVRDEPDASQAANNLSLVNTIASTSKPVEEVTETVECNGANRCIGACFPLAPWQSEYATSHNADIFVPVTALTTAISATAAPLLIRTGCATWQKIVSGVCFVVWPLAYPVLLMKHTPRNLWSYVWATSLVVVVLAGSLVVAAYISGVPVEYVPVEEWATKIAAFLPLAILYGVMEAEDGRIFSLLTRTVLPGIGDTKRGDDWDQKFSSRYGSMHGAVGEKEKATSLDDVEACWEKAVRRQADQRSSIHRAHTSS